MSILRDPMFLLNCYENLNKNKGVLTKGTDDSTAESMTMERIDTIANQIKEKTFKFTSSRRILIPKPGKDTKRPLTIANFDDRIV